MRYRKNVTCLTTNELHDLREGLAAMFVLPASDPNSFARIASLHGGPPTAYCRHGAPGFFTWHRSYLMAFETALRAVGCGEAVPYWDWSSGPSTGVPEPCRHATYVNRSGVTVPNPLYSGPRAAGGNTARRADIDTTAFDDLATGAQSALTAADFDSFQSQMNGVHGGVHVRTGGDMGSVPTASYDPIFYLHHANEDRLWAQWQGMHPGALPGTEASFELVPFNRPYSIQWQRGSDVESTAALGYLYRRFCFIFPPIRLWEVIRLEWDPPLRKQMASGRVVLKSGRMQPVPTEVRAFVNQPDADSRTKTIGNPAFAGVVGFMAHPMPEREGDKCPECEHLGDTSHHAEHAHVVASALSAKEDVGHAHGEHESSGPPGGAERFDVELDITAAVRAVADDEGVTLKLVVVDGSGNELAADGVALDAIEMTVD